MPVSMGRGKQYATVQERLSAALGEGVRPEGVMSIKTSAVPLGNGIVVVTAEVTFTDTRVFCGMSQARFDATTGADATNPVECAETSAVGRALAMAGYWSDAGLASKEEIDQARRIAAQRGGSRPSAAVTVTEKPLMADREFSRTPEGQSVKAKETPRQWYERTAPIARQRGIKAPSLAEDAPDEYVLEVCQWLKGQLQAQPAGAAQ